ncbi:NUDIX domain-containing protein [Deinococcus peraridilitoris]|uniref:ADP-ribose pyrophosphatase n=1 Tax=Deinococcus peraridilitoris (strain DSM 19664 / LMG 22246 / CIP 109416 / KR-200) TaxID=937777 RepID=K9ZW09_DEIPD|nr:NUDIX domain-containing protein [Deinococcus peraridilitoris]AFZ65823.1 ADP-ribose pyrophosphatase [Deinococcus peraridilitoris DSM 19664]
MRPIRNSAKAVIVQGGQLLVIVKRDARGNLFYILPGGGQERGETLGDTVRRECREELGADVVVRDLLCVRDYVAAHHEFAAENPDFHAVEFMFACDLPDVTALGQGSVPDDGQEGLAWLDLNDLPGLAFYPAALGRWLLTGGARRYLGDVN